MFKIKVLDGVNCEDSSCPLSFRPVVTKSNFELLLDGKVNVGIDAGHESWRWVEIGL